jgi:hypothetical protein
MGMLEKSFLMVRRKDDLTPKEKLLAFLNELKVLEARLWGVILSDVRTEEENFLEDTNHIIHMLNNKKMAEVNLILRNKTLRDFKKDLDQLRKDFQNLRTQIRKRDMLKNLISSYTIKLVSPENYNKLESIFLLEKQLNDVLDRQDEDLFYLYHNVKKVRVLENDEKKLDIFKESLKKLRDVLAGHLDHHEMWEEERMGYSNTSNILHELIKIVEAN